MVDTCTLYITIVWKFQKGNQNPWIEEGPKEKRTEGQTTIKKTQKRTKGQTTIKKTQKTNHRAKQTPLKIRCEFMCMNDKQFLLHATLVTPVMLI